jgi:hypothetical protein
MLLLLHSVFSTPRIFPVIAGMRTIGLDLHVEGPGMKEVKGEGESSLLL